MRGRERIPRRRRLLWIEASCLPQIIIVTAIICVTMALALVARFWRLPPELNSDDAAVARIKFV